MLYPQQVHIYSPSQTHDIWPEDGYDLQTLDLRFTLSHSELEICELLPSFITTGTDVILDYLLRIEEEGAKRRSPFWQDMARAFLTQMIVVITRECSPASVRHESILSQAVELIEASLPKGFSVARLAEKLNMDQTYFSILFKSHFGKSPQAYIIEAKMEQVKHMLLIGRNLSIKEVAQYFGWRDIRHFRTLFKRYVGQTPSEFINQNRAWYDNNLSTESAVSFKDSYMLTWEFPSGKRTQSR